MSRPNLVLERNLQRLLVQAYTPVLPRPSFERELEARFLARAAYLSRARRGAADPRQASHAATGGGRWIAAAVVLLAALAAVWSQQGTGPEPGTEGPELARTSDEVLAEILASGRPASRRANERARERASDSEAPWTPVERASLATPDEVATWLELATPPRASLRVEGELAGDEGLALTLGPDGRAEIIDEGASLRVVLASGSLVATTDAVRALRIETVEGSLWMEVGRLELGPLDPVRGLAVRLTAGDLAGARARLASGQEFLPSDVPLWLSAGTWTRAEGIDPEEATRTALEAEPEVRVEEAPLSPIELEVFDAEGAPLAGARLWTRPIVPLPQVRAAVLLATSDEGGRLSARADPGPTFLLVEAPGHGAWRNEQVVLREDETFRLAVHLEAGGGVRGFVVDAETGAPLSGARVLAELDQPHQILPLHGTDEILEPTPFASTLSDGGGGFELEHLSPGSHILRVDHPDHGAAWSGRITVEPEETTDLEPIGLTEPGVIFGVVEEGDGRPYPGAAVIASRIDLGATSSAMSYGKAVAGPDGAYRIEGLAAGFYVVLVVEDLGGPDDARPERLQQTALSAGKELRVDFRGNPGQSHVAGRVLSHEGVPLPDMGVSLVQDPDRRYEDWSAVLTGPEGEFEFHGVEPGYYGLFLGQEFARHATLVHEFTVLPGRNEVVIDLRLEDTLLEGMVRGEDDQPLVRGALVVLRLTDDGRAPVFSARVDTDENGHFSVRGIQPGRYIVGAFEMEGLLASKTSEPFDLHSGEPARLDLRLPVGGRLELGVVDEEGQPIGQARVLVRDARGREARPSSAPSTDASGTYVSPGLAPGPWRVEVRHPDFATLVREVQVDPGEVSRVELELVRRGHPR